MTLKNLLKKIKLSERTISAFLGVLVIVAAGALLFDFFQSRSPVNLSNGDENEEKEQQEEVPVVPVLPINHRVSQGENLWRIAEEYYGSGYNWVDIASENSLRNPSFLLVDQELIIPDVAVRWPEAELMAENENRVNTYTVQQGDSLWNIAVAVYDDGYQWTKIYQANETKIGQNPGIINPGLVLAIP